MAYTKQRNPWLGYPDITTQIRAVDLNGIENGIAAVATAADSSAVSLANGWNAISTTLTYSVADGHTFVVLTSADQTTIIPVGSRIRLTHSASVKYFIVTAIDSTTMTLYGGTDYTLAAGAITLPSYSLVKAPFGFPLSPGKWTDQLIDVADRSQASATSGTWFNVGTLQLPIPIGAWRVLYQLALSINSADRVQATLSTANNTESDTEFTASRRIGSGAVAMEEPAKREKFLLLAAKTTYFLNLRCTTVGTSTVQASGTLSPTVIRAVCAYL